MSPKEEYDKAHEEYQKLVEEGRLSEEEDEDYLDKLDILWFKFLEED